MSIRDTGATLPGARLTIRWQPDDVSAADARKAQPYPFRRRISIDRTRRTRGELVVCSFFFTPVTNRPEVLQ